MEADSMSESSEICDHAGPATAAGSSTAAGSFTGSHDADWHSKSSSAKRRNNGSLQGNEEYYATCPFPEGAALTRDLGVWPERLCERVEGWPQAAVKRARIESALGSGKVMHSHFSGELGAKTANRMLAMGMREKGWNVADDSIKSHSASEISHDLKDKIINARLKPRHLFPGIQMCLPVPVRLAISKERPDVIRKRDITGEMKVKHESCYKKMEEILTNSTSMLGPNSKTNSCCFHPQMTCPLYSTSRSPICAPQYRPILSMDCSTVCVPWSNAGAHLGWADPSIESWLTFTSLAAESDLDEINLETSSNMPDDAFARAMGPKFEVVQTCTGPGLCTDFPVHRYRFYGTALNKKTFVWVGPPLDDTRAIQKDFEAHFGTKVMLDADCFAGIDTLDETKKFYAHLFNNRGVHSRPETADGLPRTVDLKACLSSKFKEHYDKYSELYSQGHRVGYLSGAFCADLSQDPDNVSRCGPWMNALQRSTVNASLSARPKQTEVELGITGGHLYTPNELRFSSGWPSINYGDNAKYMECVAIPPEGFSYHATAGVLGNGLHLAVYVAWQLYVHAHVLRRDVLSSMSPQLTFKRSFVYDLVDSVDHPEGTESADHPEGTENEVLPVVEDSQEDEDKENDDPNQQDAQEFVDGLESLDGPLR